jgi:hypothetical protein
LSPIPSSQLFDACDDYHDYHGAFSVGMDRKIKDLAYITTSRPARDAAR